MLFTSCEDCDHEGDKSIASSLQVGDVVCSDGSVPVSYTHLNGRSFRLDPERPFQVQVKEHLSVRYDMGQWLPPKAFKDWNDCLLKKPMEVRLHPTKQDQINNLAERRNAGPKL